MYATKRIGPILLFGDSNLKDNVYPCRECWSTQLRCRWTLNWFEAWGSGEFYADICQVYHRVQNGPDCDYQKIDNGIYIILPPHESLTGYCVQLQYTFSFLQETTTFTIHLYIIQSFWYLPINNLNVKICSGVYSRRI